MLGDSKYRVDCADCLTWLPTLPADSVDLCFFSPPYEDARTYGIDFRLKGQAWVDWMVRVFEQCQRVCRGLVACVCEGTTRQFRWSAAPALLMADLHRAGFGLRKPPAYHRVGIPGSGGPDWLRNDYEFIVCTAKGKLPWSDNTAMGHPPKWAPGGEMSHRLSDGSKVNQWGKTGESTRCGSKTKGGKLTALPGHRPSHEVATVAEHKGRRVVRGTANGDTQTSDSYKPPVLANPGNVITCKVGGGLMGHDLAHDNEAPFPLTLAEFFVLSFCPPGGIALDPFCGSGTTGHAAILHGQRFVGCDVRQSQVDLTGRRLETVTPMMFV